MKKNIKYSKSFIKIKQNIEQSISRDQLKSCKRMVELASDILREGEREELIDRMLDAVQSLRDGKHWKEGFESIILRRKHS